MRLHGKSSLFLVLVGMLTLASTMLTNRTGYSQEPPAAAAPAEGEDLGEKIKTADAKTLGELLQQTEKLLYMGRFDDALVVYGALAQRLDALDAENPTSPVTPTPQGRALKAEILTGQGRAYSGLQEYSAAIQMFKMAEEEGIPEYPTTLVARGEMYLDLGRPDQAQAEFEKALQADRNTLVALFDLGKALVQQSRYEEAIRPLTRFLQQPANQFTAEAYRLRGVANGGLYKFDKALADISESLKIDPAAYETFYELGVIQLRQEDFPAAVDSFAKAIDNYKPKRGHEEEPYFQGPLLKASALVEAGKHATDEATRKAAYEASLDESQKLLGQFDEKSPYTAQQRAAILVARGIGERMLGRMGDAIRTFSQAIELNPSMGEAYFRRGICLQQIGENKMAVNDFTQAATIDFSDPRGNLWEGFVYAKLGDYHEAIRAYGDAIAASDRYTPAFVNRALAYMQIGDNKKAINDFNDALRIEPTNGDYYYKRGVAYLALNDLNKASESFASAIHYDPTHASAYRNLGDVMQKQGHADLAAEYRKRADELQKKPTGG